MVVKIVQYYSLTSYYQDDLWHREGGPAREFKNGDKEWYKHGKLHRVDGPAVIYNDGRRKQYYIDGKLYSKEDYDRVVKLLYLI